jgi:hypothetical protein
MSHPGINRRAFLASGTALGLTAVVGGCSDDTVDPNADDAAQTATSYELIATFPRGEPYIASGPPQRLPFLLAESGDAPLDEIDGTVAFRLVDETGAQVGEPTEVTPMGVGLPRAYLAYETVFPEPGIYSVEAQYQGQTMTSAVQAWPLDEVAVPQIGDQLPPVTTPTATDSHSVDPICTRDPICPFHERTTAEALAAGQITILQVSTPQFCQTNVCGPVLDNLIDLLDGRDDVAAVHVEVYSDPLAVDTIAEATRAPAVVELALPLEPVTFVTDASGVIVSRLDSIWDDAELSAAIAAAGNS